MEALGFPREVRPFQPHLTLGRIKAPGGLGAVLAIWTKNEKVVWGEMFVREVVLFQSILRPSGAEYIPLRKGFLLP
jgi:2'-5' RNA ligase